MAKRFMDSEIWNMRWFREFKPEYKLFFFWAISKCDNAGVLADLDLGLASFQIGYELKYDEFEGAFEDIIIRIDDSTWWIPQFVIFQYVELKETCRPHQSVIQKLKERGLYGQYEQYFAKSGRKSNRPSQADQLKEIEDNLKQWESDWGGVDVGSEFDTLKDWLKQSGKLKKDYSAFFRNWLKKAGGQKNKAAGDVKYLYACFSHPDYQIVSEDSKLVEFCPKCEQSLEWTEVVK